jgi:ferric-dicitrate binding protein FerR (iron transport regulator)
MNDERKNDYLWDGSGQPDAEVQRLEKLLGRYRHREGPEPDWSRVKPPAPVYFRRWQWLAAAAVLIGLIGAGLWLAMRPEESWWQVVHVEGAPQLGAQAVASTTALAPDQWLETDANSRARLESLIGAVDIEPNTRLRLVRARPSEHRLEMPRGTIHAVIWAPARQFFVETPSATAVDLGCMYTLEVAESGAGRVEVTSGWVAFEMNGRESFIPAGAQCETRPEVGPGTPCFGDAAENFKAALARLDFEKLAPADRSAALKTILAEARPRDAFSLWHLLNRVDPVERPQLYDRLARLAPPPDGVTRDAVLRGDRQALDLWWDALGHGDASWFRFWKRDLPAQTP